MTTPESARVIDYLVGAMIAACRDKSGLTLKQLAARSGVSATNLKIYESGADRIPASSLLKVAQALDTPISFFFSAIDIADCAGLSGSNSESIGPMECARVIQVFSQFRSAEAFDAAISMVRSMVVLEDALRGREINPAEISSPGGV